ncbi:MAG TPA: ABC transporter ATP-binding protein [Afipia sp.]|uniref:ABC transporter ATP-binding protein n=1 Tax=unclassified Afipia TaxID=2642050 RepID=UPI0004672B01|nr:MULTISPECIES: ABC transporter ATP-binding protein [unclassified Afipia]MAH69661.1 sugar ABC transporter [Afipia sp.]OUX61078.1 MAG: sugar ABC transporter [Afipia sp. TMED4]HAO39743.1 ABC transporter ATP-binding protein [Afipia sp.]HAP10145.1 ABC transporter ATP-binding protein [Afipia sp.]HAQ92815.1 ABC transporter ATP-binding protein [Afipia sp.]|tara:strand:+ start:669 stop:1421 length:753 start_codon:yes stop_codon:yes gene_type:complete
MTDLGIHLDNVGIRFEGQRDGGGIKEWLVGHITGAKSKDARYSVEALRNLDLSIGHGERVGLIGLNGAGKSTLLKVMAKIYPPTSGVATIRGHVCPMFEFATGFEMNQSGRDNIRIRGLLLGMSPAEIEEKLPEIAAFTELGEFLDYPVRTYSTGMFVRLAFAVSTSVNPEILLIDEVMGAGDIKFADKAKQRMFEFMEQGKILVFASHAPDLLRSFCKRSIWLESGSIRMDGDTDEVLDSYSRINQPAS